MMHGQRVGVAISHFLQLLIEFHSVQLIRLLVGEVGRKCELGPKRLLVWISAPQSLEFDVALGHFDVAWPKLGHKNGVFD